MVVSETTGSTSTILPGISLPVVSLMVTKNVATAVPSAVTVEGTMLTNDFVSEAVGPCDTWNSTVAVDGAMVTPSVVSVAVNVTDSAVVSVTPNTTRPLASLVSLVEVATAVAGFGVSVTTFPATGLAPPAVINVTVTVVP